MKIATYLLGALLAAAIGAAALFYFMTFQPMAAEYERMKAGLPALDKAKAELKQYKEKEAKQAQETAWIKPVMDELQKGLDEEIKAGKAEVAAAGTGIVVNISEDRLYTDGSVTFAKDSRPLLAKLAAFLAHKDLKGKTIIIGNTTDAVPARGKGKKRTPPREARALAADRSVALTKYLEQNNVEKDSLVAAGFGAKLPDTGFKIKDHKTVISVANPTAPDVPVAVQPAPAKPADTAGQPPAGAQQQKTIPIKPAEPKGQ
jgi:outer membrane protein OmpA-like peptidoglycan-associated protein